MTEDPRSYLPCGLRGALRQSVHLIDRDRDGALLLEFLLPPGVVNGSVARRVVHLREASVDDVGALVSLPAPLIMMAPGAAGWS